MICNVIGIAARRDRLHGIDLFARAAVAARGHSAQFKSLFGDKAFARLNLFVADVQLYRRIHRLAVRKVLCRDGGNGERLAGKHVFGHIDVVENGPVVVRNVEIEVKILRIAEVVCHRITQYVSAFLGQKIGIGRQLFRDAFAHDGFDDAEFSAAARSADLPDAEHFAHGHLRGIYLAEIFVQENGVEFVRHVHKQRSRARIARRVRDAVDEFVPACRLRNKGETIGRGNGNFAVAVHVIHFEEHVVDPAVHGVDAVCLRYGIICTHKSDRALPLFGKDEGGSGDIVETACAVFHAVKFGDDDVRRVVDLAEHEPDLRFARRKALPFVAHAEGCGIVQICQHCLVQVGARRREIDSVFFPVPIQREGFGDGGIVHDGVGADLAARKFAVQRRGHMEFRRTRLSRGEADIHGGQLSVPPHIRLEADGDIVVLIVCVANDDLQTVELQLLLVGGSDEKFEKFVVLAAPVQVDRPVVERLARSEGGGDLHAVRFKIVIIGRLCACGEVYAALGRPHFRHGIAHTYILFKDNGIAVRIADGPNARAVQEDLGEIAARPVGSDRNRFKLLAALRCLRQIQRFADQILAGDHLARDLVACGDGHGSFRTVHRTVVIGRRIDDFIGSRLIEGKSRSLRRGLRKRSRTVGCLDFQHHRQSGRELGSGGRDRFRRGKDNFRPLRHRSLIHGEKQVPLHGRILRRDGKLIGDPFAEVSCGILGAELRRIDARRGGDKSEGAVQRDLFSVAVKHFCLAVESGLAVHDVEGGQSVQGKGVSFARRPPVQGGRSADFRACRIFQRLPREGFARKFVQVQLRVFALFERERAHLYAVRFKGIVGKGRKHARHVPRRGEIEHGDFPVLHQNGDLHGPAVKADAAHPFREGKSRCRGVGVASLDGDAHVAVRMIVDKRKSKGIACRFVFDLKAQGIEGALPLLPHDAESESEHARIVVERRACCARCGNEADAAAPLFLIFRAVLRIKTLQREQRGRLFRRGGKPSEREGTDQAGYTEKECAGQKEDRLFS